MRAEPAREGRGAWLEAVRPAVLEFLLLGPELAEGSGVEIPPQDHGWDVLPLRVESGRREIPILPDVDHAHEGAWTGRGDSGRLEHPAARVPGNRRARRLRGLEEVRAIRHTHGRVAPPDR